MLKWLKRLAVAVVVLVVVVVATVYVGSGSAISKDWNVALVPIAADSSPEAIAEGERLSRITGCLSCHGEHGQGQVLVDNPAIGTIVAPSLAVAAAHDSDAELARSIRQGVNKAGRQMWIMPAHLALADADTARIIGYLRTLKPGPSDVTKLRSFGPVGRLGILIGMVPAAAHAPLTAAAQRPEDVGSYFVNSPCYDCHDPYKSRTVENEQAPPLAAVTHAYDDAAFVQLLRTGKNTQGADLGLMSEAARSGFRYLTDEEIKAIKVYLDSLGAAPAH